MSSKIRRGSHCRACGAEGPAYYMTVLGNRVPLCQGCTGDYLAAETACEVRAIDREKETNKRIARIAKGE